MSEGKYKYWIRKGAHFYTTEKLFDCFAVGPVKLNQFAPS